MRQRIFKRTAFFLLLYLCLGCLDPVISFAEQRIPLIENGQDEVEAYRYEMGGFGGFSSSIRNGETGSVNIMEFDDSLQWSVFLDGDPYYYDNDDVFIKNGTYEVIITPVEDLKESYESVFLFTIENEYEEFADMFHSDIGIYDVKEAEIHYISDKELYEYTLSNGFSMTMSTPNGGLSSEPVEIIFSRVQGNAVVYKNGEEYELVKEASNRLYFTEPGLYEIHMKCFPDDYSNKDINIYNYVVSFQILKNGSTSMRVLNSPMGYEIAFLKHENTPVELSSKTTAFLLEDGEYYVRFQSVDGTIPNYSFNFVKDSKRPKLNFFDHNINVRLEPPVSFEPMEENCTIELYYEGKPVNEYELPLAQGGFYTVKVTDQAGNFREYDFYIKNRIKFMDDLTKALLIMVIIGTLILVRLNGFSVRR